MELLPADLWIDKISPFLPLASRHSLLLTGRFLHTTFEPLVWSFMDWDGGEYHRMDAQVSLILSTPRLGAHVQRVRLYPWEERAFNYKDIECALNMMPRLRVLKLQNVRLTKDLCCFIYEATSLVELCIVGAYLPDDVSMLLRAEPSVTNIQTLSVSRVRGLSKFELALLTHSSALCDITLFGAHGLGTQLTKHITAGGWASLRSLHIHTSMPGPVPDIVALLEHLPALRSLHLLYARHNLPALVLPITPQYVPYLNEFHGMPAHAAVLCRGRPIHTVALHNFDRHGIPTLYRPPSLQTQATAQERALAVLSNNHREHLQVLQLYLTDPLLLRHVCVFRHLRNLEIDGRDLYAPGIDRRIDETPRVNVMLFVLVRALPSLPRLTSLDVRGLPQRRFDVPAAFSGVIRDADILCPALRTLRCVADGIYLWTWLAKGEWQLEREF